MRNLIKQIEEEIKTEKEEEALEINKAKIRQMLELIHNKENDLAKLRKQLEVGDFGVLEEQKAQATIPYLLSWDNNIFSTTMNAEAFELSNPNIRVFYYQ